MSFAMVSSDNSRREVMDGMMKKKKLDEGKAFE